MNTSKFRLLYFGSDNFSIRILSYLLNKKLCPIQVVTRHGSLLDQFSAKINLVRNRWPLDLSNASSDSNLFNIGLVASFGNLIDEKTIKRFEYGLFNLHPSLLPQYRGSTPVQAAIRDGIKETGCTLMKIPPVAKFDIGDIILQRRTVIKEREYALELRDRLADVGAELAEELLNNYDRCMLKSRPQGTEGKSYARKIMPEHGLVKFKCESSEMIDRKVRAYTGFTELYTYCLNGLKVRLENLRNPVEIDQLNLDRLTADLRKLKKTEVASDHIEPGTIYLHKNRQILCIKCADDRWLSFDNITPESKAKMSALDFYNGYLSRVDLRSMITDV